MKERRRIVHDGFGGYDVEEKLFLFPVWEKINFLSFDTFRDAEQYAQRGLVVMEVNK